MQTDASPLFTFYPWPATLGIWIVLAVVYCIWWLIVRHRIEAKNELRLEETISGSKLLTLLELEAEEAGEE